MKKGTVITILIIIAVIIVAWIAYQASQGTPSNQTGTNATSTTGTTTAATSTQSISDGTITLTYPSNDFGLATIGQPITANSYIPPCDPGFNYCLFYIGNAYAGTNFDSAGLRIQKRTDLVTQAQCLNNEPAGYNSLKSSSTIYSTYAVSEFGSPSQPISNAGAGHFAGDVIYRVSTTNGCYEFDTRVSQSDFDNYPAGSIQEFTTADQAAMQAELQSVLNTLTLPNVTTVSFPQS